MCSIDETVDPVSHFAIERGFVYMGLWQWPRELFYTGGTMVVQPIFGRALQMIEFGGLQLIKFVRFSRSRRLYC